MNLLAVIAAILVGLIVEMASRAVGCTVTIGGDLLACAITASVLTRQAVESVDGGEK